MDDLPVIALTFKPMLPPSYTIAVPSPPGHGRHFRAGHHRIAVLTNLPRGRNSMRPF